MTESEKKQKIRVTNIQRFSLHDGPGIRTTVFLKGCSLRCPWCANPENVRYEIEPWQKSDGTAGLFGRDISLDELYDELLKDRGFYLEGGGVTFSGGEPLLQIEHYLPLLEELKQNHIHLAIETALFVDQKQVEAAIRFFDWWYVDMKLLVPEWCRRLLNGDARQYLDNLTFLTEHGISPTIRIPCVHGYTDTPESLERIAHWIKKLELKQVEIFGIHDLAREKYKSLGREWPMDLSDNEEAVRNVARFLNKSQIQCKMIRI